MRAEEERHWWYRGNRAMVKAVLGRRLAGAATVRWLDVACGSGGNLAEPARVLGRAAACVGLDLSAQALELCRARRIERVVRASLEEVPFAAGSFDVVTCFEALYHEEVADWRNAIAGFARVLAPSGWLLL